jgi:membrane-associated phospholipid phosphatase
MSLALREEHPLLSNSRRDVVTTAVLVLLTAAVFILVGLHPRPGWVQRMDDRVLREMVANRTGPFTAAAKTLDVLGGLWVMLIVRLAVGGFLALRRRWWHLAAFVLAIVVSEALIAPLKALYDRPRPPASLALVGTSGSSFPSGHAVAASVTVVALVLALFPTGPHRWGWGTAAALFSFVMAVSRAYLAAHWLSDAVAGTLLAVTVALGSALVVQWIKDERSARAGAVRTPGVSGPGPVGSEPGPVGSPPGR